MNHRPKKVARETKDGLTGDSVVCPPLVPRSIDTQTRDQRQEHDLQNTIHLFRRSWR